MTKTLNVSALEALAAFKEKPDFSYFDNVIGNKQFQNISLLKLQGSDIAVIQSAGFPSGFPSIRMFSLLVESSKEFSIAEFVDMAQRVKISPAADYKKSVDAIASRLSTEASLDVASFEKTFTIPSAIVEENFRNLVTLFQEEFLDEYKVLLKMFHENKNVTYLVTKIDSTKKVYQSTDLRVQLQNEPEMAAINLYWLCQYIFDAYNSSKKDKLLSILDSKIAFIAPNEAIIDKVAYGKIISCASYVIAYIISRIPTLQLTPVRKDSPSTFNPLSEKKEEKKTELISFSVSSNVKQNSSNRQNASKKQPQTNNQQVMVTPIRGSFRKNSGVNKPRFKQPNKNAKALRKQSEVNSKKK